MTLIDTPGFGVDDVEEDLRTVRQMVDVLKEQGIFIYIQNHSDTQGAY